MSCIIGLIQNKKVYLGADSFATTDQGERRPIIANKLFRNGKYLIGFAGSVRGGRLLADPSCKLPTNILKLADAIQDLFVKKGCVTQTEDCGLLQLCNFLIGYKGKLYEIMSDFQMSEVSGNFTAVGSGAAYAMGALYVMQKTSASPESKITRALEAASLFATTVGPPFIIKTV
jgi:ATP-dependent protease HslVU (ClpYQ) peptidase subunit